MEIDKKVNKKVFQSNANCLFVDSMGYTVNKFEHVREALYRRGATDRQTNRTENITFATPLVAVKNQQYKSLRFWGYMLGEKFVKVQVLSRKLTKLLYLQ